MAQKPPHPTTDQLSRFLRAEIERPDAISVVRHLLKGCIQCRNFLAGLRRRGKKRISVVPDYTAVCRKAELAAILSDAALKEGKQIATQLWETLADRDHPTRLLIIKNDRRFQIWGLYDHIEGLIRRTAKGEPFKAVDLAHLGLELALHLDAREYGAGQVNDFIGSAYRSLAHAKRRAGDLQGAAEALEQGRDYLGEGTGDPVEDAMLGVTTAALLNDMGEFRQAVGLLNFVLRLFRSVGDARGVAYTRIQQASILAFYDSAEAIKVAEEALETLPEYDNFAELSARHTIAWCYNDLGDHDEALQIVRTYDYLYGRFDDPVTVGQRLWLLGRIYAKSRSYEAASIALDEAYGLYLSSNLFFEATLITLDRVEVMIYRKQVGRALEAARKLVPRFKKWGLKKEAMDVWGLMIRAVENGDFLQGNMSSRISFELRQTWFPRPPGVDLKELNPTA